MPRMPPRFSAFTRWRRHGARHKKGPPALQPHDRTCGYSIAGDPTYVSPTPQFTHVCGGCRGFAATTRGMHADLDTLCTVVYAPRTISCLRSQGSPPPSHRRRDRHTLHRPGDHGDVVSLRRLLSLRALCALWLLLEPRLQRTSVANALSADEQESSSSPAIKKGPQPCNLMIGHVATALLGTCAMPVTVTPYLIS
jgi:hypothetical protein